MPFHSFPVPVVLLDCLQGSSIPLTKGSNRLSLSPSAADKNTLSVQAAPAGLAGSVPIFAHSQRTTTPCASASRPPPILSLIYTKRRPCRSHPTRPLQVHCPRVSVTVAAARLRPSQAASSTRQGAILQAPATPGRPTVFARDHHPSQPADDTSLQLNQQFCPAIPTALPSGIDTCRRAVLPSSWFPRRPA